jgi:hypothetical protein
MRRWAWASIWSFEKNEAIGGGVPGNAFVFMEFQEGGGALEVALFAEAALGLDFAELVQSFWNWRERRWEWRPRVARARWEWGERGTHGIPSVRPHLGLTGRIGRSDCPTG